MVYPTSSGDLQTELVEAASKRLDALLTENDRTMLGAEPAVRVSASVAATIIDYAKHIHVDVIVVGTHGRTDVRRLLMGSVADRVIRTASCPVLIVGGRH